MWEDKTLSFSSNVKSELSHHFGNARHCNIAELAAILNMCGHIAYNRDKICVKIQTENPAAARKYFTLLKKLRIFLSGNVRIFFRIPITNSTQTKSGNAHNTQNW